MDLMYDPHESNSQKYVLEAFDALLAELRKHAEIADSVVDATQDPEWHRKWESRMEELGISKEPMSEAELRANTDSFGEMHARYSGEHDKRYREIQALRAKFASGSQPNYDTLQQVTNLFKQQALRSLMDAVHPTPNAPFHQKNLLCYGRALDALGYGMNLIDIYPFDD